MIYVYIISPLSICYSVWSVSLNICCLYWCQAPSTVPKNSIRKASSINVHGHGSAKLNINKQKNRSAILCALLISSSILSRAHFRSVLSRTVHLFSTTKNSPKFWQLPLVLLQCRDGSGRHETHTCHSNVSNY